MKQDKKKSEVEYERIQQKNSEDVEETRRVNKALKANKGGVREKQRDETRITEEEN
jgi:hypothetical protein